MRHALLLLLLPVFSLCAAEDTSVRQRLANHWKTSREFTAAIAAQMPEDGYSLKPNSEQMTFGEQVDHIASANFYFASKLMSVKSPYNKPAKLTKDALLEQLTQSFSYMQKVIEGMTPAQFDQITDTGDGKMSGLEAIMLALDHTTHHRGQLVVYLRVKGIKPSEYRF